MNVTGLTIVCMVITIVAVVLGVGIAWGIGQAQIAAIKEWIKGHEHYCVVRDTEITMLRENGARLTVLAEQADQHLRTLDTTVIQILRNGRT